MAGGNDDSERLIRQWKGYCGPGVDTIGVNHRISMIFAKKS
jgi:hypothetical protein